MDAYVAALEKLIAKKRLVKQGAMQELLTGKQRLPGFSEEWVEHTAEEISEAFAGGTPSTPVVPLRHLKNHIGMAILYGYSPEGAKTMLLRSKITKHA